MEEKMEGERKEMICSIGICVFRIPIYVLVFAAVGFNFLYSVSLPIVT